MINAGLIIAFNCLGWFFMYEYLGHLPFSLPTFHLWWSYGTLLVLLIVIMAGVYAQMQRSTEVPWRTKEVLAVKKRHKLIGYSLVAIS